MNLHPGVTKGQQQKVGMNGVLRARHVHKRMKRMCFPPSYIDMVITTEILVCFYDDNILTLFYERSVKMSAAKVEIYEVSKSK